MPAIDNSRERIDFSKENALRHFFSNLAPHPPEREEPSVVHSNQLNDRLVDEKAAGEYLGVSVALMRKMRSVGNGPAFCRIGRLVRYQQSDLAAFIKAEKERVAAEKERVQ